MEYIIIPIQIILTLGLLLLSFVGFIPSLDEYPDDPTIPYCDNDGEVASATAIVWIWLTSALILGVSLCLRFFYNYKGLRYLDRLSIFLSTIGIFRFVAALQNIQKIDRRCPWLRRGAGEFFKVISALTIEIRG